MQAVRQIVQVVDRQVTIDLPSGFEAEQVEVIVLPAEEIRKEESLAPDPVFQEFLALDTSGFTPEQKAAHERVSAYIRRGRKEGEPYPIGLFEGFGSISDDFDAPMPDEDVWYGSETDEYGLSLTYETTA